MPHVIVWDIETVPDLKGFAAANGHDGKTDDESRAELGEKFPKHIFHSIICIGALIAHRDNDQGEDVAIAKIGKEARGFLEGGGRKGGSQEKKREGGLGAPQRTGQRREGGEELCGGGRVLGATGKKKGKTHLVGVRAGRAERGTWPGGGGWGWNGAKKKRGRGERLFERPTTERGILSEWETENGKNRERGGDMVGPGREREREKGVYVGGVSLGEIKAI